METQLTQFYFKLLSFNNFQLLNLVFQQLMIRLAYKLKWPEHRMILNESADWSDGEINVRPELIDHFWSPDIIIHDLIR